MVEAKSNLIRAVLLLAVPFFLACCGGDSAIVTEGSPGPDGPSADEPSDPAAPSTALEGVFLDNPVGGIEYETPTHSGITDAEGHYEYEPGETVTFFLGDIVLGSVLAGPVLTPLELVPGATSPADTEVLNLLIFLQTLDDDGDPSNGITITQSTRDAAVGNSIDFTADPTTWNLTGLTENLLVSAADALANFVLTLQGETTLVAFVFPPQGATGVLDTLLCKSVNVSVTFTVDVDPETIGAETVLIFQLESGDPVPELQFSYDAETRTASVAKGGAYLDAGAEYVVTLTTGLRESDGTPLAIPYSWSFAISEVTDAAPCPPQNLAAHGWDSTVSISWDRDDHADSFKAYKSTAPQVAISGDNLAANVAGSPFTDWNVLNDGLYFYALTAVNTVGESEGSAEVQASPVAAAAFRMTSLDLRDPHLFVPEERPACNVSTNADGGLIDNNLKNLINKDSDGDGLLDLSQLLVFRPLDESPAAGGRISHPVAECPYPSGSTICDLPNTSEFADPIQAASAYLNLIQATSAYQNQDVGVCLAVIAETTSRYSPPITEPTAGAGTICWASQPIESLPLEVGIPIPLNAVQMGAEYDNFPAENLGNGLLRGFLPESAAFEKFIPNDTPLVGGMRLSSLLRGEGDCSGLDDRDRFDYDNDGDLDWGWWFYFNFTAERVEYVGP